jgi:hypothetical protein
MSAVSSSPPASAKSHGTRPRAAQRLRAIDWIQQAHRADGFQRQVAFRRRCLVGFPRGMARAR